MEALAQHGEEVVKAGLVHDGEGVQVAEAAVGGGS